MQNFITPLPAGGVNMALLGEQCQTRFAARYQFVNMTGSGTTLTVTLEPGQAGDQTAFEQIVAAHNPTVKTTGQQRKEARETARGSLSAYVARLNNNAQQTEAALKSLIVALGLDNGD